MACSALTNTARCPARLNTIVFLFFPERKPLPLIVMRSPTPAFIGVTFVTTGYFGAFFATAVAAGNAITAAAEMVTLMIWTREKDMPRPAYRPLDELLEAVHCRLDASEA